MNRKQISQKIRKQVYEKYNGHCAYCGCKLEYKDMQVDHIIPMDMYDAYKVIGQDLNHIDNLFPSCRMCNFYKSTFTVEKFRQNIQTLHNRLERTFIYRLAKRYGIIIENKDPIVFYFEKEENVCNSVKNQES